ncbi:MAG: hypothetical protein U1G08_18400 [Verrucomicrobiota bacterium]
MKRVLLSLAGVAGVLLGTGFIFPAVALWRSGSPDTAMIFGPLVLGIVLIAGAVMSFRAARRCRCA